MIDPMTAEFQMQLACMEGQAKRIDRLLSQGVNADFVDASERPPASFLACAAQNGHLPVVEKLLKAGADPNPTLPIARALEQGHYEIAEALIQAGADLNHADSGRPLLTRREFYRWATPEVVQWALQNGARPTVTDRVGLSALERARRLAPASVVSLLESQT